MRIWMTKLRIRCGHSVSAVVPEDLHRQLQKAADDKGVSVSEIVRDILVNHVTTGSPD